MGKIPKLRGFLKESRILKHSGSTAKESAERFFKNADSGFHSIDSGLKKISPEMKGGVLDINGHTVGEFNKAMRSADFNSLSKISKSKLNLTSTEISNYKSTIADFPEIKLRELDESVTALKKNYAHLDLTVNQIKSAPESTKRALADVEKKGTKIFGAKNIILTIGGVVFAASWITASLEKRKGCFMITTNNVTGKTTSCRVGNLTCGSPVQSDNPCNPKVSEKFHNVVLTAYQIVNGANTESLDFKDLLEAFGATDRDNMKSKLPAIIKDDFEKLSSTVEGLSADGKYVKSPCSVTTHEKEVSPCRMCDTTADPKSSLYLDESQIDAENVTFKCVTDPSVLDLIGDIFTTTGENLLKILPNVKKIGIYVLVAVAILAIISLIVKFIMTRRAAARGSASVVGLNYQPLIPDNYYG